MTSEPLIFVGRQDPHAVAWVEPGAAAVTFGGLAERAEALRQRFVAAQFPERTIIAAGTLAPLDLVTGFLAASSDWAFAAVSPNFSRTEREEYLHELLPGALLDGALQFKPLSGGRILDATLCLLTSATTGRAKIVPLARSQLEAAARNTRDALELSPSDRLLCLTPLHHLQALGSLFAQWSGGGSVVYAGPFDAARFPRWLDEFRPTWFTASPTMLDAILAIGAPLPRCLRFIRTIGAPLPAATMAAVEDRLQVPVIEGYGLTEIGVVTSNPLPPRPRKAGSAGPSAGPEVRIAANDEILVRGPALFGGYLNQEAQPFDEEGWFRTGDLGCLDADGYLRVMGRLKEIVNRGGEKIVLGEVDRAVHGHPAVREAAAFSVPHPTLGEDLACAVVLRPGHSASARELRHYVRQVRGAEKVPRHFVFLDALPRGAMGKVQRKLLSLPAAPRADLTGIPTPLCTLWREALHQAPASAMDDFFQCGGDSLSAASFLAAVSADYAIPLEQLDPFFENPNLACLAALIQNQLASPIQPRQFTFFPKAPGPALFLIGATASGVFALRALAQQMGPVRPVTILRTTGEPPDRVPGHLAAVVRDSIAAIRELQPRGPYLLAGHCYGGIVAFEVARQLMTAAESIRRLVLLDAPCPGPHRLHARWSFLEGLVPLPGRPRGILPSPPRADLELHQVYATQPRVRTLVLEDSRFSWRRFTSRPIHLQPIEATHESMLQAPAVEHVAPLLSSLLDP
ncbi:MAG TPA: alpha/beta fold hydrolase [Paludibaculum sp.]|jgi:acyl-coenzyme A synthetase/AMP-(fatty) acid ligase/thioesterase domain-containing protein